MRRAALALLAAAACTQHPPDHLPRSPTAEERPFASKLPAGIEKLRMGLVPHLSPDRMRTTRAPLVAYLSGSLGVPVEMVVGADYDDVGEKLARGELDLAEFSPYSFVRAKKKAKLRPLVSAISAGSSTSGGYIIVRDDSPRRTIEELRGARFGFVDPASTSGYLYPMKLFKDRGIDPKTFFSSTAFLGSHDGVLLAILDGGIEAGATWQGSFGALKSKTGVDPLSFKVIAKMPRTPQDLVCVREDLPHEVGDVVKELLLRLSMRQKADRDILSAMSVNGYVEPDLEGYAQVERIANELDAGEPVIHVTVSHSVAPELHARAKEAAQAWGLPFHEREKNTGLPQGTFLVLGGDGWTLRDANGALRFSEGLARLRIKRIEAGETDDVLVRLCELKAGDHVLDCTFGLGADAQVCAFVVGGQGRVVGIEKSLPLWALASEGLRAKVQSPKAAPIEVRHADCVEFLRAQKAQSFDCVLFDPMFGRRKKASPAFELLRAHADHEALPAEAIGLARRAARRWVVVKGARYSEDMKRLGLQPEPLSRYTDVVWARVKGGI